MLIMHTLQSHAFLAVLLATAFLGARLIVDVQARHLARPGAPERVFLENPPAGTPEPEPGPHPQLRLVWSAPATLNDEPYDQAKDLAL